MSTITQILSVARFGNPLRAWSLFVEAGLDKKTNDFKTLTLKGRLLKDQARLETGAEQSRLYREAASAYAAAVKFTKDSYPLINAATLALMGGDTERSVTLAQDILLLLDKDPDQGENAYWRLATEAEAWLLLGDIAGSSEALAKAVAELPHAWEDHAATLTQFELILAHQNSDASWLDQYRPPPSLYFNGMITLDEDNPEIHKGIEAIILREKPGFGFGALAAGADILIAEALHKAGADLHITLPYSVDRFRELSVTPFGEHWVNRFDALINVAVELDTLDELPDEEERSISQAVDLANQVTMGKCIRNAETLRSLPKALSIIDENQKTHRQYSSWSESGYEQFFIYTTRNDECLQSEKLSKSQKKEITAILWVEDLSWKDLSEKIKADTVFYDVSGGFYSRSNDLLETLKIAGSIVRKYPNCRIRVSSLLTQTSDMARASSGGVIITDYNSAMIVTLLRTGISIEEIGELKTAYGPIDLWRLF